MATIRRAETLGLRSEADVVSMRQAVRRWAAELKFSLVDQTKLVTAASELGRNALIYGLGGTALLEILDEPPRTGLRVTFEDQGPGIPDIDRALQDGFTSGGGLGLGLGGAKRLVNQFELDSRPGEGTRIAITRWK